MYIAHSCTFTYNAALIKDCIISLDDRYLYVTCWVHGDVRQYDITDTANPKLVGQVRVSLIY